MDFISKVPGFFNIHRSFSVIDYINKLKDKPHDYLNICRESLLQNPIPIYDINSSENKHRSNTPQLNKSHIWQNHIKHYPQCWKIESLSSKIRRKTRVPILTITKRSAESPIHSNQKRKMNKRNPNWKRRNKHQCLQMTWSFI